MLFHTSTNLLVSKVLDCTYVKSVAKYLEVLTICRKLITNLLSFKLPLIHWGTFYNTKIFSNTILFEINTVPSSLFWYHPAVLTTSIKLCLVLYVYFHSYVHSYMNALYNNFGSWIASIQFTYLSMFAIWACSQSWLIEYVILNHTWLLFSILQTNVTWLSVSHWEFWNNYVGGNIHYSLFWLCT